MISVLLADDQHLVRAGFRSLLRRDKGIQVVGEASTGDEAVRTARELRPDVILMDIRMPGMDGIAATRAVLAERPETRVIILTTFETDEYVFAALAAGASGFLTKEIGPDGLRQAVKVVAAGDALLSPSVTRRVVGQFASRPVVAAAAPGGDRLAVLTDREREVVRLVAAGLSNEEIARELVISPLTAKTHITRAITKLGVRDRVQLVIIAFEDGLAGPLS
ncbi:response regulator transcription factor [Actinoplanes sp. LDG1-06]|uniref:Response regulator transcription factor n=1 Tax=Paractinoplanes ovalisporus TaxID=2810368 RepID=A0ABS2AQ32_9ACTN|nr:response regulator transcription factor [Actinoplanes ovalisporus]MBM2621967.1 response regulator transcription factor [Actinoplanes ovalisporus]